MARYRTDTLGEYAHLLMEDAAHAIAGERRGLGDDEPEWVSDREMDPIAEVAACFKELSHHLAEQQAGCLAYERLLEQLGHDTGSVVRKMVPLMMDAKIETSGQWAWVYTGEDGTDE